MAVYTHVSTEDLQQFLAQFDVGDLTAAKGIAEGVENSNYLVHTTRDRYILTLYEKRVDPVELPFFLGLLDHLAHKGLPCPGPVASRDGVLLHQLAGRPACLIHFADGVSVTEPSLVQCRAAGVALAQIRDATADFGLTRPNALGPRGWMRLAGACGDGLAGISPELAALVGDELEQVARRWPADLPVSTIHADLFLDNVLFMGEAISGLIDFYFACTDIAAYDLAVTLNAWAFDADGATHHAARAAAMVAGYDSVHPLSAAERAALPLLCQGAALRFLLTRAYDWLNRPEGALVTPKDPMAFARRLAFYRGASTSQCTGDA